jgi:hypothetical protein
MLIQRIIGAFTFRKEVYAEVEKDTSFTTTAWILVAVVAFLNQLGAQAGGGIVNWLLGAILGTVLAVAGFAVGVFVINWVARTLFNADVTFEELVRTLGLAYVWQVIGLIGILAVFSDTLACVLAPVLIIAWIAMVIAWFIAAKEALDLEWAQTIITVIVGWVALFIVSLIAAAILGLLGLGAAAVGGAVGL